MMSGDNFTEEVSTTRVALEDLTNRPFKREFSSILDDLGSQSESGPRKIVVTEEDENLHLAKQSSETKIGDDDNGDEKGLSLEEDNQESDSSATDTDIDIEEDNVVSVVSNRANENKEALNLLVTKSADEVGDASRDSCASTGSMPACSWSGKKDSDEEVRLSSDVKQKNPATINVCTTVEKDLGGVGRSVHSLCGSVEWSRLQKSQGSKSFELDRCTTLKGDDGCANLGAGADLLKGCNCSFCMKAAYIWSDLHYQDIKGRLAALKKSQKEASILTDKYARGKQTEIHSSGNFSKSSNLESNLTAQWKSLFHHMEDIFVHESNQLQAGYVALKDLRENCKTDLETITGMPSNKYEQ